MNVGREESRRRYIVRIRRLAILISVAFTIVGGSYWYTQAVKGAEYRALAENNRLREQRLPAPRGLILDRHGRSMVENVPSYRLLIDRSRTSDVEASLAFAARTLDLPLADLDEALQRGRGRSEIFPVLLAADLTFSQVARIEASGLEHPEFEVDVQLRRFYRLGDQAAHVLGYIGEANQQALDRRPELSSGDQVGIKGAESTYDSRLRGEDGSRVIVVDSRGRVMEEHQNHPARHGVNLQLTLDLQLQQEAERYFEDRVGSVVAMDPRTGEILAMVSAPSFNPNSFARGIAAREWRELLESPNDPLQNRALQNSHSPGSIFKIVTAVAALEEGIVTPADTFTCNGSAQIYNHRFRCWKAGGHGTVNLHEALKHSCNVYFYQVGQRLGIDRISEYARRLGLGSATGIDLEGEKDGLVPDRQWSLRQRKTMWFPGETISVSIGQGPLLVTPLQVAVMMSAVANGGSLVTPRLVMSDIEAVRPLGVSDRTMSVVREALAAVVEAGTARAAAVPGLRVAGKTATAQVVNQATRIDSEDLEYRFRDHAWFASFAPMEAPELVVVVFVEHGGHGGNAAAPLAKRLYETHFGTLPSPSDT